MEDWRETMVPFFFFISLPPPMFPFLFFLLVWTNESPEKVRTGLELTLRSATYEVIDETATGNGERYF